MRFFFYWGQNQEVLVISDDEIRSQFYADWRAKMIYMLGAERANQQLFDDFLDEWVYTNSAWESIDE